MEEIVRQAHAGMRDDAVEILRESGCPVRDHACQTKAIYDYILSHFYWVDDPVLEETLLWPEAFMRQIKEQGRVYSDCASVNVALLSLLGAIGIRGKFVFGSDGLRQGGEPVVYHVWSMVEIEGKPFYLEPTAYLPAGKAHRYKRMYTVDPWQT
jgi:hypothetical protein